MHEIVVGTGNPAKTKAIQAAVAPLRLRVRSASEFGVSLMVREDGPTAQDNARAKSVAYAQVLEQPVLSIDNALFLDGLPAAEQPGVDTRRVPGVEGRASDTELLAHYAGKVAQLGGRVNGYWEYALCLADPAGLTVERTFRTPRTFVREPSTTMIA